MLIEKNKKQDLFEIKKESPKNFTVQHTKVINPLQLKSESPVQVVEQPSAPVTIKAKPLVVLPPSACQLTPPKATLKLPVEPL